MLKNEFQSMIEQYSNELMNISRQSGEDTPVNAQPTAVPQEKTEAAAPMQPQNPQAAMPPQPTPPPSQNPMMPMPPQNQAPVQPPSAPPPSSRQPRDIPNNNAVQTPVPISDDAGQYQDDSANMTYEQFLSENPGSGVLKVQVFSGQQVTPIPNAEVTVSKTFLDGQQVFFSGLTDISGIVDGIELPAPSRTLSESPQPRGNGANLQIPYSQYNVMVKAARHRAQEYTHVPVFDGIKSIQPVRLTPIQFTNGDNGTIVFPESEPNNL